MSIGSIIIICVIGVAFVGVCAKLIYDKVKGKGSCTGNCAGCSACHAKPKKKK